MALAAKHRSLAKRIIGVDRNSSALSYARRKGVIDAEAKLAEAVADADLVVLAVPVGDLIDVAAELAPGLSSQAVVTDVGSVKRPVVERLEPLMPRFVGGHPMAGGEQSGAQASSADLFDRTTCFVTPTAQTDSAALAAVERLWEGFGARIVRMDPQTHDEIVAAVSHLPHLVAYALVNTVAAARAPSGSAISFAAAGFRDTTRIAASSPELWRDICLMNRGPLLDILSRYQGATSRLHELIQREDGPGLVEEFSQARTARERLS